MKRVIFTLGLLLTLVLVNTRTEHLLKSNFGFSWLPWKEKSQILKPNGPEYSRAKLAPNAELSLEDINFPVENYMSSDGASLDFPTGLSEQQILNIDLSPLARVRRIFLEDCILSKRALDHLAKLKIEKLEVNGCKINDTASAAFQKYSHLQALSLNNTILGDEALENLKLLPLKELHLQNTFVSSQGIEKLSTLPLKTLNLEGTEIDNSALYHLEAMEIESLNISGTKVDNEALDLLKNFENLQELFIKETSIDPNLYSKLGNSLNIVD